MRTNAIRSIVGALLLTSEIAFAAVGTNHIIAPSSTSGREGNSSAIPLDTGAPERFQQVFSSTLFADYPEGVRIHEILFRGDAFVGHPFSTIVSDIEIHFSTIPISVDSLSPVFDLNVGADDQIVVGRDPFRLTGYGGGDVYGPWSIDFYFPSSTFFYNPSSGNLLLDIKVFAGITTSPFDASDISGDSVSSVFGYGLTMPTFGQTSSLGLASDIHFDPVPEPTTTALIACGGVIMALILRKKIQRKRSRYESS